MMNENNDINAGTEEYPYYRYSVGLDIGQVSDSSAIAVIKRSWRFDEWRKIHYHYYCGYLHRWPLGTKYNQIIEDTTALCLDQAFLGQAKAGGHWRRFGPVLAVDATGVGSPIIEGILSSHSRVNGYGIIITGGTTHAPLKGRRGYSVPKKDLIGSITKELQSGKLTISRELKQAPVLLKELKDFRAFTSASGNEKLEHRSGRNDDLVLAISMACWISTKACLPAMALSQFWK